MRSCKRTLSFRSLKTMSFDSLDNEIGALTPPCPQRRRASSASSPIFHSNPESSPRDALSLSSTSPQRRPRIDPMQLIPPDANAYPSSGWTLRCTRETTMKIAMSFAPASMLVFVIIDTLLTGSDTVRKALTAFLLYASDHHAHGAAYLIAGMAVSTVLCIPGSLLAFGSGYLFGHAYGMRTGVWIASSVTLVGASAGAVVSFFLGRHIFRDAAERLSERYTIVGAIDAAIAGDRGLAVLVLFRLSPIVPFNVFNYAIGATGARAWHNTASLVFMTPEILFVSFVGAGASDITGGDMEGRRDKLIVVMVGVLFGGLAVVTMSFLAQKELEKISSAAIQRNPTVEITSNGEESILL
mmetsp:Transcript_41115/g.80476  ORF Transcript_41115/g.80476 Transcript_41115/m.80476 type:complete len:355 (+) Transcript_41115:77-1141(+)